MPLFFVLTGYIEYKRDSICNHGFGRFIKNKVLRLLVPYFCFEVINCVVFLCYNSMFGHAAIPTFGEIAYSILTCINTDAYTGISGRLWFLPCMFVSEVFVYLLLCALKKVEKYKKPIVAFLIVFMFFLSFLTTHVIKNRLPFTVDTAFFATAFILIGYFFGKAIDYLVGDGHYAISGGIMFLALSGLYLTVRSGNASVLMYINCYGEYLSSIVAAVCGIIAFFIIGKWSYMIIKKVPTVSGLVLWYGNNSLATFPVHLEIKWAALVVMGIIGISSWVILFVVMLFINIPCVEIINKVAPFIAGKKKRRI